MKLNEEQKRNLIWILLIVCCGGLMGGFYFSPVLIISVISLLGIGGTFFSFNTELSDKINNVFVRGYEVGQNHGFNKAIKYVQGLYNKE